jgi:hypothetical protein
MVSPLLINSGPLRRAPAPQRSIALDIAVQLCCVPRNPERLLCPRCGVRGCLPCLASPAGSSPQSRFPGAGSGGPSRFTAYVGDDSDEGEVDAVAPQRSRRVEEVCTAL